MYFRFLGEPSTTVYLRQARSDIMANSLKLDDILSNIDVTGSSPSTESSSPEPTQQQEAQEVQEPAQVSDDSAKSEDAPAPEAKGEDPGPIPYNRFREKNEEAKHLRDMNEQLQKRLELMESQAQQATPQTVEEPKEEAPDPLMERVKRLAEDSDNDEMAQLLVELAQEVRQTKTQSTETQEEFRNAQVQRLVAEYEKKIGAAVNVDDIYDKASARNYVLQVLNQNPSADINEAVKVFKEYEQKLEQSVLKRHGYATDDKQPETAQSQTDEAAGLPSRQSDKTAAPVAPSGGQATNKKQPITLREMKRMFTSDRRRAR
jgi:hypothetical protein